MRRYCWSVQKPYFGGGSIGVKKQTQMMVVQQNILSNVMLKNVKLSYENVRFHLPRPDIYVVDTLNEVSSLLLKSGFVVSETFILLPP